MPDMRDFQECQDCNSPGVRKTEHSEIKGPAYVNTNSTKKGKNDGAKGKTGHS